MNRLHLYLLLLVVAFIPYSVALFTGQQLGPTEHIQTMVTPGSPVPSYGWDVLQADGVLQFLPWRDLVFDAWRHGEAPIINPYQLAGQPLTANSQSGGFYPLHVIFAFLPGSTGTKILLLGILHLLICGTGLYYLLRNLKCSETASLIGSIAFTLSQFMVAWAPLASVPSTVAWIPWFLAGITCSNRRLGFFQTALATAMMLYAGHLQFAFYGMFAALVVWTWQMATERKLAALVPAFALIVGIAASMPQLGIVLKNSATSHRRNVPSEQGYNDYSKGVLAPFEALSFINPKLLGDPSMERSMVLGDQAEKLPTSFWPAVVKPGSNPAESALWITPFALILALFGLMDKRKKDEGGMPPVIPGLAVAIVGVLLAFGSPLNQLLFFNFPGWSATGSPGRAHVLIVLGLCLMAAVGYDRLEAKNQGERKWYALAAVPLVLLAIGFNVTTMVPKFVMQDNADAMARLISRTMTPNMPGIALSVLLGSVLIAALISKKLPNPKLSIPILLLLTLIAQRPLSGKALEVPEVKPDQERHMFVSKSWNMFDTPSATMPPNIASLQRVHDLFGYDSILDKGFVEKLTQAYGRDPAPPENGNMMLFRAKDSLMPDQVQAFQKLGVLHPPGLEMNGTLLMDTRIEGGTIEHDGYDHQIIKPLNDAKEILVRDRFIPGMKSPTPNTTVEDKDGWRLIKTDGKQTQIRIDYPGRTNYFAVIIGVTLLLIGYVISVIRHEPNPTTS